MRNHQSLFKNLSKNEKATTVPAPSNECQLNRETVKDYDEGKVNYIIVVHSVFDLSYECSADDYGATITCKT